jgi:hypothetical protein
MTGDAVGRDPEGFSPVLKFTYHAGSPRFLFSPQAASLSGPIRAAAGI